MATATSAPGKSDFIRKLLDRNPLANFKAVNEAWTAAGNDGSISQALVNKLRSEAGLSGNLRNKGATATESAQSGNLARTRTRRGRKRKTRARDQGKTPFVKEFLNDHPEGTVGAVNEAWTANGFDGSISGSLVNRVRSELGLTGNLRGKSRSAAWARPYPGKKRGRKPKETSAAESAHGRVETRGRKNARTLGLIELEGEIDRLLFKVMGLGDHPEIEDSLRQVRRKLYKKLIES